MATKKAKPAVVDIADLLPRPEDEAPTDLALVDPHTGKDTGITLKVVGSQARAYRRALTYLFKREGISDLNDEGLTLEQVLDRNDKMGLIYAAAAVVGWEGAVWGGKPFDWSIDNAYTLVSSVRWIGDAVIALSNSKKKPATD